MSAVRTVVWPGALLALLVMMTLASPSSAAVSLGDKAPDFALRSVDGQSTVKLSNMTTEPTLLVFWVSWCGHCQRELPVVQKVYRDLGPKGMNAVGVSVDKERSDAQEFVKDYKVTFPNAFAGTETGYAVVDTYGVEGVPTMFVIDKNGLIKASFIGETDEKILRDTFAELGVK